MKLLRPDHQRRIKLDGVPNPVPRPVDIDQSQTGFTNLRTLRIYRFEPQTTIDGHAEEDEVLIVVLAGSIELSMSAGGSQTSADWVSVAGNAQEVPCAAYLPPMGVYRLIPKIAADVAYIRATPSSARPPKFFTSQTTPERAGISVLLDESTYPEKLGIRLLNIDASRVALSCSPLRNSAQRLEALIHLRDIAEEGKVTMVSADSTSIALQSWDTVAAISADHPALNTRASTLQALVVFAR